jgi:hypothetical protein
MRPRAAAALVTRVEAGTIAKTGRTDGVGEGDQRSRISGRQGSRLARHIHDKPAVGVTLLNVWIVVIAENSIPLVTSSSNNDVKGLGKSHSVIVNDPFPGLGEDAPSPIVPLNDKEGGHTFVGVTVAIPVLVAVHPDRTGQFIPVDVEQLALLPVPSDV